MWLTRDWSLLFTVFMDMHGDSERFSRMSVVELGRRRRWPVAEKVRIVEESQSGDRRASATARRYDISNSLMFKWRKAYREGRLVDVAGPPGFVPAVLVSQAGAGGSAALPERSAAGRMEVVTTTGHRIVVGADVDALALARVVAALSAL